MIGDGKVQQWPDWFKEALKQRFDKLSLKTQQETELYLSGKLVEIRNQLLTREDIQFHDLINEFEDYLTRQHSMEAEMLYMQGVQDGMRIMCPVNKLDQST